MRRSLPRAAASSWRAVSRHAITPGAGMARLGRPRGPVLPGRRRAVRRHHVPAAPHARQLVGCRRLAAPGRGAGRAAIGFAPDRHFHIVEARWTDAEQRRARYAHPAFPFSPCRGSLAASRSLPRSAARESERTHRYGLCKRSRRKDEQSPQLGGAPCSKPIRDLDVTSHTLAKPTG